MCKIAVLLIRKESKGSIRGSLLHMGWGEQGSPVCRAPRLKVAIERSIKQATITDAGKVACAGRVSLVVKAMGRRCNFLHLRLPPAANRTASRFESQRVNKEDQKHARFSKPEDFWRRTLWWRRAGRATNVEPRFVQDLKKPAAFTDECQYSTTILNRFVTAAWYEIQKASTEVEHKRENKLELLGTSVRFRVYCMHQR